MLKWQFFFKLAISGIQRGGQRSIAAILTVAFGVMSLISMSSLSDTIYRVLMTEGQALIGGDIQLYTYSRSIPPEAMSQIEDWKNEGLISEYTLISSSYEISMQRLDGTDIELYGASYGINPQTFPLISGFVLTEDGASLASVLQNVEDIAITQDLAIKHQLVLGERLRLMQLDGLGTPLEVRISGVVRDNPDHSGGHVYYRMETAQRLAGYENVITDVIALSPDVEALRAAVATTQWIGIVPDDVMAGRLDVATVFDFMLKGSGILGLLVGGIGIANTMQVLLSRRRQEIAILKTLGYSQWDMMALFILENFLLSLIGTVIGAGLAYLVSGYLVQVFANTGTILLNWEADAFRFITGMAVGLLTSFIFAFYAILRASEIRPALIFRQEIPQNKLKDWLKAALVYGLLSIPFGMITTAILGDVLMGIGIILLAIFGFLIIGAVLSLLMWFGLRIIPSFRSQILRLARNNTRKRRSSMLFAMVALFLGIYALGFASAVLDISWEEMQSRQLETQGYNVIFYGRLEDKNAFEASAGSLETEMRYIAPIREIRGGDFSGSWQLEARDEQWDIRLEGTDDAGNGVWLWAGLNLGTGTEISITTVDGQEHSLVVVGTYDYLETQSILLARPLGLIVSHETLERIAGDEIRLEWYAETSEDIIQDITAALPQLAAESSAAMIASLGANFRNLFIFAVSMAGLALLAAVMLIANAVGLAMLERRYEIGVMKAIGYTRRHVLLIIAYEYGLIALVCSLIGILAVQVSMILIGLMNGVLSTYLLMRPQIALLIVILGVGLSLMTALLSSIQLVELKPSVVLKSE